MAFWESFAWLLAKVLGLLAREYMEYEGEKVEVLFVRRLIPGWAWAQTWGRVILVRADHGDENSLNFLLRHEVVHVRQWKKYGFFFPFAYLFSSVKAFLSGKRPYYENEFEAEVYKRG